MRCRRSRMAITERRLHELSPAAVNELRSHLASCDSCAGDAGDERTLFAELASLREDRPIEIDVRGRVLREIAGLAPFERREVPRRELGWAVAATAVALATVVWLALSGCASLLPQAIRETRWIVEGAAAVVSAVARPFGAVAAVLRSFGGIALDLLSAFSLVLGKLAVVPQVMMALSIAVMISITTFVVARDLGLLPMSAPRKEHGS